MIHTFRATKDHQWVMRDDGVLHNINLSGYQDWVEEGGVLLPYDPLEEKAEVLAEARKLREIALNRLTGIQLNTADAQTVAAIQSARSALLNITSDAGVLAATDGVTTKSAVLAAWRTIALTLAATAPSAASVFVGLGMQ